MTSGMNMVYACGKILSLYISCYQNVVCFCDSTDHFFFFRTEKRNKKKKSNGCKWDKKELYKQITKTECKEAFLLNETDLQHLGLGKYNILTPLERDILNALPKLW